MSAMRTVHVPHILATHALLLQVRPGESFTSLATRFDVPIGLLMSDNVKEVTKLDSNLPVGRRLKICKATKGVGQINSNCASDMFVTMSTEQLSWDSTRAWLLARCDTGIVQQGVCHLLCGMSPMVATPACEQCMCLAAPVL
jgi:hypothetical protein